MTLTAAYTLTLTESDLNTIAFVGARYAWADALSGLDVGENPLTEPEAWEIGEAFEADTEGGHAPFPMLDPYSELYDKLTALWEGIV